MDAAWMSENQRRHWRDDTEFRLLTDSRSLNKNSGTLQ